MTLAERIYRTLDARNNCIKTNNQTWFETHTERLEQLTGLLPHGSGIDGTNQIDMEGFKPNQTFRIFGEYHHMNANGYYTHWSNFTVKVQASFYGPLVTATGGGDADTNDYLAEVFQYALTHVPA